MMLINIDSGLINPLKFYVLQSLAIKNKSLDQKYQQHMGAC